MFLCYWTCILTEVSIYRCPKTFFSFKLKVLTKILKFKNLESEFRKTFSPLSYLLVFFKQIFLFKNRNLFSSMLFSPLTLKS